MEYNKKENLLANKNIQDAIFFMVLCIVMVIYSLINHYNTPGLEWKLSPYLFPILISIFIGLLSISLFAEGFRESKIVDRKVEKEVIKWKDVLFTIIISVAYYFAMGLIGFIVSTILFLATLFVFLGEKRIWIIASISIVSTLAIYFIFGVLLHVMLP